MSGAFGWGGGGSAAPTGLRRPAQRNGTAGRGLRDGSLYHPKLLEKALAIHYKLGNFDAYGLAASGVADNLGGGAGPASSFVQTPKKLSIGGGAEWKVRISHAALASLG